MFRARGREFPTIPPNIAEALQAIVDINTDSESNEMTTDTAQTVTAVKTHSVAPVFSAGATFATTNTYGATTGITAFATGGQASATALTTEYNDVTVCATAGDSVKLITAALGAKQVVRNSGATALAVFGQTGATIDGGSANASVTVNPGCEVVFEGISATAWKTRGGISGAVTQITSISTGVTLNALKGLVTTFSATNAAGTSSTFTVTNSFARATSNIRAYVVDYGNTFTTQGLPIVSVDNRAAGAFDIVLSNAHSANALSGVVIIGFEIVA